MVFADYNELEASLEEAVKNILNTSTDYAAFDQLYYTVYQIVVTNFGHALHRKLENLLADYLRKQVLIHPEVAQRQNKYMLYLVEQDRKGENIDRKMLQEQCNMLAETNVLLRDNERLLSYVEVVHSILSNEAQRAELCFAPATTLTLIEELEDTLIKKRLNVLTINSDCLMHRLLKQEGKTELVQQLSLLLQRIPEGMNPLIACVCKHVTDRSKSYEDETLDNVFNEWLVLFNYLDSKDVFELLYRQHLARRLLKSHSRNPQESDIVDKFRENCGYVYTSRMNGMLKDVEVFTDLNQEFDCDIKPLHEDASKLETLVQVITPKYWPLPDAPVQCVLPVEAFQAFSLFSHYYLSQHERRQLTLLPQLGDAEVVMWVEDPLGHDRRYTLQVDTLQMTILVLFNHAPSLTYEEIQNQTEIPDRELAYSLRALSSGKKDVLTRYPAADKENIGPGYTFVFNSNYRSRKSCVKLLPRFHRDQSVQQQRKEEFDRRSELEAAVVRVVKALGRVQELRLVLLVTDAVKHRFRPTPDDIKRVLPSLIERAFLKPSPENSKIYVYVP
ncbi:hypothetical protein B566_EDAN008801 [Ephemera danica]|nr:hypothetical protein B566_EDAN008801 [Ephemera danica]